MGEPKDCPQVIPLARAELIDLLCADPALQETGRQEFRQVAELITTVCHAEYHQRLLKLKTAYAPFDPDADTTCPTPLLESKRQQRLNELLREFAWLLDHAGFKHLSREEIEPVLS